MMPPDGPAPGAAMVVASSTTRRYDRSRSAGTNRSRSTTLMRSSWWAPEGSIVFSTQADVGQTMGPRRHLCRIEAGGALFGMDLSHATEGFRMLAVGVADTVLLELRRPKLLQLAKDPAYADRVCGLLEGWVDEHVRGGGRATPAPERVRDARARRRRSRSAPARVSTRRRAQSGSVIWREAHASSAIRASRPSPGTAFSRWRTRRGWKSERRNHADRLGHAELRGPGRFVVRPGRVTR